MISGCRIVLHSFLHSLDSLDPLLVPIICYMRAGLLLVYNSDMTTTFFVELIKNIQSLMKMFRSDKGSQSNKGRSPYLIGQIRARALPSQIRPILVR